MACYHPLLAVDTGRTPEGKKIIKFLGYVPKDTDKALLIDGRYYDRSKLLQIPCGQCVGCRLEYSRQWANRCMLELQYHDSAYFATFTYDDDHVPRTAYGDPATGEAIPALTLDKRDFQLLMKRIRKNFPNDKIRFFMSGEYGSQTFRPHYHAILFGLHLSDLTVYKTVKEGGHYYTYYNSPSLQKCWPKGFVVVGHVTWESCAYTARYVMKKLKGAEAKFYDDHNIVPEFTLMSRKPGIARQYYDEHPELYSQPNPEIIISTEKGGKKFRPPKYFERLFENENPVLAEEFREFRKAMASNAEASRLSRTSLDASEYRRVQESALESRLKSLRRGVD
nr:replication initiation protein [Gokushovirinae sp.]